MMYVRAIGLVLACGLAVSAAQAGPTEPGTSITIYSSAAPGAIDPSAYRPGSGGLGYYQAAAPVPGYAVVREIRPIEVGKRGEVRFTDVAAMIDPTTVQFTSLTDPRATVLEQDYQFDLVNGQKLLEKFVDQEVRVGVMRGTQAETLTGTLLSSAGGQLVLRTKLGTIEMVNGYTGVSFVRVPEGLMTRPTLVWKVAADAPGPQTARVSYQTSGITWWADYNLVYADGKDANSGMLDVAGWASILNQSGGTYTNATLKLIAGDVHRAPNPQYPASRSMLGMATAEDSRSAGFQEKAFFEYHLYTLGRPATIPDNSTKQLELFAGARGVPCAKVLVYDGMGADQWWGDGLMMDQSYGNQTRKDVDIYLKFSNTEKDGLGMPLPAGRVRVSKLDEADGSMEFIGEDVIRHTPRDEQVLIRLGKAFDVVGERTQTDFQLDTSRKRMTETYEIKVRNRKQEAVSVIVQEHLFRWVQWEITSKSTAFEKINSRMVHFPLTLAPGAEGKVTYTVTYTW